MMKETLLATIKIIGLIGIVLSISGCSTLSYYSQSVIGHSRLMLMRQPVDKVLGGADDQLRAQLLLSKRLKAFAVAKLDLPISQSYTSYVPLKREFPVWTVVAAPEFSLVAKRWCYPVIGCASYRGYFSQAAAISYAEKLMSEGFETQVGGAPAYSTLGWFADPLLPSMMRYGDTDFAETLFHEMAHQQLYINGDSDFNEAFASLVGEIGAIRWLELHRPEGLGPYKKSLVVRAQFNALVMSAKSELEVLYQSNIELADMDESKQDIVRRLKQRYDQLRRDEWEGEEWYKSWFDDDLNNAKFAALSTYRERIPQLRALLSACDNSLPRFYKILSKVKLRSQKVILPLDCR